MGKDNYLHCYKMVWDTEFAPNPHHGVLTLATCKPRIRKYANVGDWISGWTSVKVHDKDNRIIEFRNGERLIYIAKISKIIPFDQYWHEYPQKRPHELINGKPLTRKGCRCCREEGKNISIHYDCGDNIYKPVRNNSGKFVQLPNGGGHNENDKDHDLSGKNVLICNEFYYFGVHHACKIDKQLFSYPIPRWKKIKLEDVAKIINYIQSNYKSGIVVENEDYTK